MRVAHQLLVRHQCSREVVVVHRLGQVKLPRYIPERQVELRADIYLRTRLPIVRRAHDVNQLDVHRKASAGRLRERYENHALALLLSHRRHCGTAVDEQRPDFGARRQTGFDVPLAADAQLHLNLVDAVAGIIHRCFHVDLHHLGFEQRRRIVPGRLKRQLPIIRRAAVAEYRTRKIARAERLRQTARVLAFESRTLNRRRKLHAVGCLYHDVAVLQGGRTAFHS